MLWRAINCIGAIIAIVLIAYPTLVTRDATVVRVRLIPFYSFVEAKKQPEIYRQMLMNVFLFVPLGLTLSEAMPVKRSVSYQIWRTVLFGFALSCFMELLQLVFALGLVETDDVLTNTLGTFIGASHLWLAALPGRIANKFRLR